MQGTIPTRRNSSQEQRTPLSNSSASQLETPGMAECGAKEQNPAEFNSASEYSSEQSVQSRFRLTSSLQVQSKCQEWPGNTLSQVTSHHQSAIEHRRHTDQESPYQGQSPSLDSSDSCSSLAHSLRSRREKKCKHQQKYTPDQSSPTELIPKTQSTHLGPAAEFLINNQYSEALKEIVADETLLSKSEAAKQVYCAIMGGYSQCSSCCKFHTSLKWKPQHEKKCKDMLYRISFVKLNNRYFCYFGCNKYTKRSELVLHLIEEHRDQLEAWGISAPLLADPTRATLGAAQLKQPNSDSGGAIASYARVLTPHADEDSGSSPNITSPVQSTGAIDQSTVARPDDSVLVRFLIRNATPNGVDAQLAGEVQTWKQMHNEKSFYFFYNLDSLRSDAMTAFSIITNLQKVNILRKANPQLQIAPVELGCSSDGIVSMAHKVDAKTPIMLYRQGMLQKAHLVFAKALWKLMYLHSEYGRFQGGVELHHFGLTDADGAYFFDWAYSVPKEESATRQKSSYQSYWKQSYLQGEGDLFSLDLLALLFSYAELISELCEETSFYKSVGMWNLRILFDPEQKIDVSQTKAFAGSWELNELLAKYCSPGPVYYDDLKKELDTFFRQELPVSGDPFWAELRDYRKSIGWNRRSQKVKEEHSSSDDRLMGVLSSDE